MSMNAQSTVTIDGEEYEIHTQAGVNGMSSPAVFPDAEYYYPDGYAECVNVHDMEVYCIDDMRYCEDGWLCPNCTCHHPDCHYEG